MSSLAHGYSVLAAGWLLCACGSEPATPGTRATSQGTTSDNSTNAPGQRPGSSAAGSDAHVLPSAPTSPSPRVGMDGSNICEVAQLTADPLAPDMMIVLDRSGSMKDGGRWQPSVAAVRKITSKLETRIRFGLALFPDDQMSGSNDDDDDNESSCAPGRIVVPVADMNAAAIGTYLDRTRPRGGTPTSETLMKVASEFSADAASPDAKHHPKYVLLVTDGAPTCPAGRGRETTQTDIDSSNFAVETLTDQGVKTYVIGYDTNTPGNEMLADVLDGFAQRGGTGDQAHRPVEDEASLTSALENIASAIASCSFTLDKAPPRADHVLVTLDGKQLNLDDANGWRMTDDRTVEIVGQACETFKAGAHLVNAEVQCTVVTPS
jgi:hypothetical protein